MRSHGNLTKWNDERGFGFITPAQGSGEIFVHISAFPRDGTRPRLNELISYETEAGDNGKLHAVRIMRPASRKAAHSFKVRESHSPVNWMGSLLAIALLAGVGAYGYNFYKRLALENSSIAPADIPAGCDGRTMCSQMTSCAEAKWFINNCPGTTMDGDHDGTPCEQQWCTSPFAN